MELLTRVSALEQEKTTLMASNLELERSNANLREAMKVALKERDQATVEMNNVQQNFNDHINNVELWLPQFSHYHETEPFLNQLRANRGVPLAAKMVGHGSTHQPRSGGVSRASRRHQPMSEPRW